MPWGLTIALSVGGLGLTVAFAMALGKVTGHADRHAERYAAWTVALAAVPRESSTGAPSPRASVGTMRLPARLNLPTSSGVPKPRGDAPARVAFCIDFPEAPSPRKSADS